MRTIQTIAELAFTRNNPNPQVQTGFLGDYIESAKIIYAARSWYNMQEQKRLEGEYIIPSQLLVSKNIKVKDNKVSISGLNIMRSIPGDLWVQGLGDGECDFTRLTYNESKMIDLEVLGDTIVYRVVGNNIEFLTDYNDTEELQITFVSDGSDIESGVDIDDIVGQYVLDKLIQQYSTKVPEDKNKQQ